MSTGETPPAATRSRRLLAAAGIAAAVLLVLALAARIALQPTHVAGLVLDQLGKGLGLEIRASGVAEYRVRGTPQLVVRDVVAREPGAAAPVLRARRIFVSLPWSTIRARGSVLDLTRIELDAPRVDLPALQHWLARRPPSETRIPTLRDGLWISDGLLQGQGWSIDRIGVKLPMLAPDRALAARVTGRYLAPPTRLPFALAVALTRPQGDAGLGVTGTATLDHGDWRLPAHLRLSGLLHAGTNDLRLTPARLALAARYEAGSTTLPFALGLHGPLRHADGTWTLAPAGVALRGKDPVPSLDARGALAFGQRLVFDLGGRLAAWPQDWPALPPPVGTSTSPLPFGLRYAGKADLSDIAGLRLQRDATRFDARLRLPDVLAWIDAREPHSILPPLDGRLTAPRLEIAGARLEGVEVRFDDPDLPAPEMLR